MEEKIRVLVFPCGSEIGLEVNRSLKYSRQIDLIGASSIDDHGELVYEKYINGLPHYQNPDFIKRLKSVIKKYNIDVLFPTMDGVIEKLKFHEKEFGCKVISSPYETVKVCTSKIKMYNFLKEKISVPKVYSEISEIKKFPVFVKPEVGYGSRGAIKFDDLSSLKNYLINKSGQVIMDFLPGKEYTVDCFSDFNGNLKFSKGRERIRINNGISVRTIPVFERDHEFVAIAEKINQTLKFSGAWFFQLKEDENGTLVLLEVASRLAGSSSLYRAIGVNFALLSIFNSYEIPVLIIKNNLNIKMDRALNTRFKVEINFEYVYVDFDDCLIFNGKLNLDLLKFLYQCINETKKIILITKHEKNLNNSLRMYRLENLFDEVIHIKKELKKFKFIKYKNSIFIDDSFQERNEVYAACGIPVFAPDAIDCLFN